jgi:hypothetical protein
MSKTTKMVVRQKSIKLFILSTNMGTVTLKPFQRIIAIDNGPNISAIEKQSRSLSDRKAV